MTKSKLLRWPLGLSLALVGPPLLALGYGWVLFYVQWQAFCFVLIVTVIVGGGGIAILPIGRAARAVAAVLYLVVMIMVLSLVIEMGRPGAVQLENRSAVPLTAVTMRAGDQVVHMDVLPPGARRTLRGTVRRDGTVGAEFTKDGKRYDIGTYVTSMMPAQCRIRVSGLGVLHRCGEMSWRTNEPVTARIAPPAPPPPRR